MEINRYLKDLGLTWYDLPGNYISKASIKIRLKRRWYKIKRGFCFMFSSIADVLVFVLGNETCLKRFHVQKYTNIVPLIRHVC